MITREKVLTPDKSAPATPFPSLAAMRAQHQVLLKAPSTEMTEQRRAEITAFLASGTQTGTLLQSRPERSAAQALLDYWVGVLVNSPEPVLGDESALFDSDSYLLEEFDAASAPDLSEKRCPYIGLAAFLETDADRFYGREEAVQALLKKVESRSLVLVTGVSGSGKSSLVYAGLIPALKVEAITGSQNWNYLPVIMPGNAPIRMLLSTACPAGRDAAEWCSANAESVSRDPDSFAGLARSVANNRPSLLIVDQFEELFTLCDDQAEREAYAAALVAFSQASPGNRLILTIREDFLREAAQLPAIQSFAVDPDARFTPPAMTARELRRVIESPAATVGLKFDEGIVDDLVKEVAGEPTALPLLQFTLLRLWEDKQRNRISWDAYRHVGNPREALKRTADAVYSRLPQDLDRQIARVIFLELVRPSVGYEFVRRRVRRESLRRLAASTTVDGVLQRFVAAGLIRVTPGIDADDDRFEVVHEALLRNWPLLTEWLDGKRQQSKVEIQLASAARLWKDSGRKSGYLLTGDAVNDALRHVDASADIRELVEASQKANSRRKRWVVTGLSIGCLLLAGLALEAFREKGMAEASLAKYTEQVGYTRDAEKAAITLSKENEQRANELAQSIKALPTRPALLLCDGKISEIIPPEWADLKTKETQISKVARSTGLVRLEGHPSLYAAGTAFVVAPDVVMTTCHVADTFQNNPASSRPSASPNARNVQPNVAYGAGRINSETKFDAMNDSEGKPDDRVTPRIGKVTASIDFGSEFCNTKRESFEIVETLLDNQELGIALLKTAPLGSNHPPLRMPATPSAKLLKGKSVYIVSYMFADPRVPPDLIQVMLRGMSSAKRLSPGKILGVTTAPTQTFAESKTAAPRTTESVGAILNDCTTLGGSSGGPLVDLETGAVLGVHSGGTLKILKENYAIPNSQIISDPRVGEILNNGDGPNSQAKRPKSE